MELKKYFDQVWVLNLRRREDRLKRFWGEVEKAQWPFARPIVFSAIEGDKVGVPKFWQTGGGSYGCMRSHLTLLERAIQDDVKSILIMEDDAVFLDGFHGEVAAFLAKVPDDWQCLMLGGQHVNSTPYAVAPGVVRAGAGGGIQRTHCYALRGKEIMKALYSVWANAAVHCDWVMGPCVAKFNTYAPDPFLVGQGDGKSDISGQQNPSKFWRSPSGYEPVVILQASRSIMEALQSKGFHGGHTRDSSTGLDVGLRDIFIQTPDMAARKKRLRSWIDMIQGEVVSMTEPGICTIWHPEVTIDMVRPLVKGQVLEIAAATVEEAMQKLPIELQHGDAAGEQLSDKIDVVLLDAPRAVMEVLREGGWHTGHWRDAITGQDNGLRKIFASELGEVGLRSALLDTIRTLHQELKPGGIVTLWHESIKPSMLDQKYIRLLMIKAGSAHEANLKLKQMLHAQE